MVAVSVLMGRWVEMWGPSVSEQEREGLRVREAEPALTVDPGTVLLVRP